MKTATSSVTYYPLKKQRSETWRPSTATTTAEDENAFTGGNDFTGDAAHIGLTVNSTVMQ